MEKEKYLQIFNYLLKFSNLRNKPTRHVNNYESVIWFVDMPHDDTLKTVLDEDYNLEDEYFIEIEKPIEPIKPSFASPPVSIRNWIDYETLVDYENGPQLKPEIFYEGQTQGIEDYPEVKERFIRYTEGKWIDDLIAYQEEDTEYQKEHERYKELQAVYSKLFKMYNKVHQFAEEYELIIGIGLLSFLTGNSLPVQRHVLVQKLDIEFIKSTIRITPNIDNLPMFETDFLVDLQLFNNNNLKEVEKEAISQIEKNDITRILGNTDIIDTMRFFAERISSDSEYISAYGRSTQFSKKPITSWVPAIILRKRNTQPYTHLYENIIESISNENVSSIPIMDEIVGVRKEYNDIIGDGVFNEISYVEDQTIYFPKPFNDEQIRIVHSVRNSDKVLVQGPPGTGKSHTISNLICNILANGKKVLITAYTKRALDVIKGQLPEEVRKLAVSFLSGDASSIDELKGSINSISSEISVADLQDYRDKIKALENELNETRKRIAANTNELNYKKDESLRYYEISKKYSGRLIEIAEQLDKESKIFDWYKDDFCEIENVKVLSKIESFLNENEFFSSIDKNELIGKLPKEEILPSVDKIIKLTELKKSIENQKDGAIENLKGCNIEDLVKSFKLLKENYLSIKSIGQEIKAEIATQYQVDKGKELNDKAINASAIVAKLDDIDLKTLDRDVEIKYPPTSSLKQLKNDAKVLLKYVRDGNSLSGFGFKLKKGILPKEIKEKFYLIKAIKINSSDCDTEEELELLIQDIEITQDFQELEDILGFSFKEANYYRKLEACKKAISDIESCTHVLDITEEFRDNLNRILRIQVNSFSIENLEEVDKILSFNQIAEEYDKLKLEIEVAKERLSSTSLNRIAKELCEAIDGYEIDSYDRNLNELSNLYQKYDRYQKFQILKNELKEYIPETIETIELEESSALSYNDLWNAINYKYTKEFSGMYDLKTGKELVDSLDIDEKREKELLSELASKKAWEAILTKLSSNKDLRKHLEAWGLAVSKIGKSRTSQRSIKFRKEAKAQMEHCKDAVPCWIMPLYKVAETIKPEKGMFDYVIVDEASQLGPDAIFLLFIAKKIIIVGDDKQTSPEYVGVDQDIMIPYIKEYLKDIPFANFYDTTFSFFDHAKMFCSGDKIVLREHFRCMPEIIEFSNKHFYEPEGIGLFPLKQYPENRLEPLMHKYCNEGSVEGKGNIIHNRPEAEMLVKIIIQLDKDSRYSGKTFGVIVLQGTAQAGLIESLLTEQLGTDKMKKRNIVCGNSSSFQGDERDIIFLSLITALNHSRRALTSPEDQRRFNVAMSRAKEQVWLFHSVGFEHLNNNNKEDLRFKVLNHFINFDAPKVGTNDLIKIPDNRALGNQPKPFESWFEVDVYNDIVRKGYKVQTQYKIAKGKYRIDLAVVLQNGTKIGVECDGDKWHGIENFEHDMTRQRDLERVGWQIFRVKGYEYYSNRVKALEKLWELLDRNQIIVSPTIDEEEITQKEEVENPEPAKEDTIFREEIDTIEDEEVIETPIEEKEEAKAGINKRLSHLLSGNSAISGSIPQNKTEEKPVRFFNLFSSGIYIMTDDNPLDAEFVVPIYDSQRKGFLLQCYDNGHVNKVNVITLQSKRLNKEYKNGLNRGAKLIHVSVIENDKLIGLYYRANGSKRFKAHLTSDITSREQLHLQGYKVLYGDFRSLSYKILPLEIHNDIDRLVFSSFTATGKPFENEYYKKEWKVLRKFEIK